MKTFSMALRNLGRNRSRTAITIFSMAFAGSIMILYMSLAAGFFKTLEKSIVETNLGELQIHGKGYRSDPDLYNRIENPASVMAKALEMGFNCAPRLYGFGLAAFKNSSSGVMLRGVDLINEPKVTKIHKQVFSGFWLDASDPKGVVIGRKLAHTLGVKAGDELVVISQASDGSMANDIYKVRGVLKSIGEAIDQGGFLMVEPEFRRLMAVPQGSHEIAMKRINGNVNLELAAKSAGAAFPELEVKSWKELQPIMARMMDVMDYSISFMIMISYSAVGMIILNATLMNVFERIREFGIMKALGVSPWQIFSLISVEALVSAAFACAFAVAVGLPAAFHFQGKGVDISSFISGASVAGVAIDTVIYFHVSPAVVSFPVLFMFALVIIATVYPAAKASLINPVEALHNI